MSQLSAKAITAIANEIRQQNKPEATRKVATPRKNPAVQTLYWCIAIMLMIWSGFSLVNIFNNQILPLLVANGLI